MTINSVNPLWNEMPLQQPQAQTKQENPGVSFADIFRSAINEVAEAQNQVANAEYLLSTGQSCLCYYCHCQGGTFSFNAGTVANQGVGRLQ